VALRRQFVAYRRAVIAGAGNTGPDRIGKIRHSNVARQPLMRAAIQTPTWIACIAAQSTFGAIPLPAIMLS
jgi:hypothetical protein